MKKGGRKTPLTLNEVFLPICECSASSAPKTGTTQSEIFLFVTLITQSAVWRTSYPYGGRQSIEPSGASNSEQSDSN
jgi:hypothetical protein